MDLARSLLISLIVVSGFGVVGCVPTPPPYAPSSSLPPPPSSLPPVTNLEPYRPLPPFEPIPQWQPPSSTPHSALDVTPSYGGNLWKPLKTARKWNSIVLHHTATERGSVDGIHQSHLKKKWLGIGYHFVIGNGQGMGDGEIEPTFRWREQIQGAHAGSAEYNERGIGIVLIGNFNKTKPTPKQLAACRRLVATMKRTYGISSDKVLGHGSVKATECPGKNFPLAEVAQSSADEAFSLFDQDDGPNPVARQ